MLEVELPDTRSTSTDVVIALEGKESGCSTRPTEARSTGFIGSSSFLAITFCHDTEDRITRLKAHAKLPLVLFWTLAGKQGVARDWTPSPRAQLTLYDLEELDASGRLKVVADDYSPMNALSPFRRLVDLVHQQKPPR